MHLCHPSRRKNALPSLWLGKEQNQDNWILCSNGSEYTLACGGAQDEKGLILSGHAVFLSRKSPFYRVLRNSSGRAIALAGSESLKILCRRVIQFGKTGSGIAKHNLFSLDFLFAGESLR
jgi:hypothetical protein